MRKYFLLVLVVNLIACQNQSSNQLNDKDKKDKEKIVINVESQQAYLGNATARFKSTAILEADRAATVTTKTSGIILDILVEEGDVVTRDQTLLVLESNEQKLSLQSAKANYEKSLNNYERAQQLVNKGLTNKEQLDNLKFETLALKSQLDQAKMNLSFTQVQAPFDGVVVRRHVKIGNLIQNATAVFDVVDFSSLQAKIDVPEHQWNIMKPDLDVKFEFDALSGSPIIGKIIRVSPVIDSKTGTFQVTVEIDNSDGLLRPGLFAKADIIYDQRENVVLVDKNAIIREDELSFVYVLKNKNKVNKVQVELGYEMEDTFEVINGLTADQIVITTGKNNITPDTEVNVVSYDDSI